MTNNYSGWNREKGNFKRRPEYSGPTSEEVTRAVAKFVKEGGLIQKLPEEPTPLNILVNTGYSKNYF